ncbi:hypothetical protein [Reichenbachiella sp.]|uniref:hypothetical protein n=1 Tax=Reichenbachiella sp. TaxID=2184521 RepID=UPI003298FC7D
MNWVSSVNVSPWGLERVPFFLFLRPSAPPNPLLFAVIFGILVMSLSSSQTHPPIDTPFLYRLA